MSRATLKGRLQEPYEKTWSWHRLYLIRSCIDIHDEGIAFHEHFWAFYGAMKDTVLHGTHSIHVAFGTGYIKAWLAAFYHRRHAIRHNATGGHVIPRAHARAVPVYSRMAFICRKRPMAMYFPLDSFQSVLFYILTIRLGTTTARVANGLLITDLDG